ncbi:Protein MARD1 [Cucurbita argyrosperma subsp. argyrosperma]|nr:Protein MARD1 [Cucurbita argyrosperma subsp. argyrosperma]
MLAKGQRPIIGRLSELLVSRCRPAFLDTSTPPPPASAASPTSHFDLSPSPRGNLKNYNAAVGLGIVAALDTSTSAVRGCDILVKHAVFSPKFNSARCPAPIPIALAGGSFPPEEDDELDGVEENYTYVTTRGPHESSTRVYYDGGLVASRCCEKSPPIMAPADETPPRRTADFLRSCHLCGKNLEGKDIYIYKGELAFCSPECRSSQITKEETKERCRSETRTAVETGSNSPYNRGIFSTGILAI